MQTPKFVVMLTETYHGFKLIPTDGRAHRDDAAPSYRGDSVGRWDGDTLVVDTTNFTDENWIYAEGNTSFHSDALRVVERYRRTAANLLEVDATIEDPKVLTAPYKVPTQTLQLAPFDQIMELTCANTDTVAGDDWQLPRHLRAREVQTAITRTREGRAMAQFARFLAAEVDTSSATIYLWDARFARASRDGWAVVKVRIE